MWAKARSKFSMRSPRPACLGPLQSEVLRSRTLLLPESKPSKLHWRQRQRLHFPCPETVQLVFVSKVPVRKRPRVQSLDRCSSGQKPEDTTESAEA